MVPGYVQHMVLYIKQMPALAKFLVIVFSVATEYVFPIFPGDTVVILSGFLHAHGAVELLEIVLAVVLGSLLGAFFGYQIGAYFVKKPYKYVWIERIANAEGFKKFNIWYQRWGLWLLLANRFFPGIRAFFFIAAGSLGLSKFKVLSLGMISALLFNGCLVLLGYWVGYETELILHYFYSFNAVFYALMALLTLFLLIIWYKKRNKK